MNPRSWGSISAAADAGVDEDLDLLEKLEDRLDLIDGLEALEESEREGAISLAQLKAELGF